MSPEDELKLNETERRVQSAYRKLVHNAYDQASVEGENTMNRRDALKTFVALAVSPHVPVLEPLVLCQPDERHYALVEKWNGRVIYCGQSKDEMWFVSKGVRDE